jgi:RNA polymerase sigma-70 factor, ECF subfamily
VDDAAFRAFYQRHARAVWGYLCRVLGNPSQADDVLQEAFCRFLTAPVEQLDEHEQRAYLFRIASNLAIDHFRRHKRDQKVMEDANSSRTASSANPSTPSHAHTSGLRLDLSKMFSELKPQERALLWLAYVEGSAHDEIADSLGLKPKSIRVLLFRARRRLAALLRQKGWGTEAS